MTRVIPPSYGAKSYAPRFGILGLSKAEREARAAKKAAADKEFEQAVAGLTAIGGSIFVADHPDHPLAPAVSKGSLDLLEKAGTD